MQRLFENRRQALKVRLFLWFSALVCLGTLYASAVIYQTYGLSPGDGEALRPIGDRLALAGLAGALGLVFAGGMMIYASIYVLRIDQQGNQLVLKTIAPWGFGSLRHEIRIEALTKNRYHNGRFSVLRATGSPGRNVPLEVDAPWITIAVQGRRLPFLLDVQAEHINSGALRKLITDAVAEWMLDRG